MIQSIFYLDRGKVKKAGMDDVAKIRKRPLWIDIIAPTKNDTNFLKKHFNFHRLALEDTIQSIQRSKIDDYGSFYFISMHAINYKNNRLTVQEIDFFLGKNFVITVHNDSMDCVDTIRKEIMNNGIMQKGPDFLMYVMMDVVVDNLFPVMDSLHERLEKVENEVFKDPGKNTTNHLFNLRRNIVTIRKYISPQREVLNILTRGDAKYIHNFTVPYLRDVYDHIYRVGENIDLARDAILSAFESYRSTIQQRTNEIMKMLTVISVIVLPMSLVAGIYGMNFKAMPELAWQYGYPFALITMFLIAVIMVLYFKKKEWL